MGNVVYQFIRYGTRDERRCDDVADALAEALADIDFGLAVPLAIIDEGQIVLDEQWIRRAHREEWFAEYNFTSPDPSRDRATMN